MTAGQQIKPDTAYIKSQPSNSVVKYFDIAFPAILLILAALTFGRTLESFFIADDFGEVSYVHRIFNGEANLFWSNFTGNYMQIPSMAVWRPWLLATLVFDYAVWKANAFGYYLTNLLYYAGNSILIYALVRNLTSSWTTWRSQITSFFTAALFTVSPLHCESVTWVVGRVDIACCFYYLLSFLLLLNTGRRQKLTAILATISFWLALWTKEMAIGLPVMVTAHYFLLHQGRSGSIQKIKQAFSKASPLWISTLVYFPLRYLFLGTLTGGYTGSIGASQFAGLMKRWLDPDTLHRVVYPLNYTLFQDQSIYTPVLTGIYLISLAVIVTRFINRELSIKWATFLFLWLATCAVPIYQLWGLGYDLEGSRFYYFLSLPLSFALPLLLFQPSTNNKATSKKWPLVLSALTLAALVITLGKIAYATNTTWVHAGKETKAVLEQSKTLSSNALDKSGQYIVLGLPKRNSAAHMILNGETYHLMLKPPFTRENIADKFITFEPILFGPAEFINPSRFKSTLKTKVRPLVWSGKEKRFQEISFVNATVATPLPLLGNHHVSKWQPYHAGQARFKDEGNLISIEDSTGGDGLSFSNLSVNPLSYDFLSFELETKDKQSLEFKAHWNADAKNGGQASQTVVTTGDKPQLVSIPLSRYWRWFTNTTITDLHLLLPSCKQMKIKNVKLVPDSLIAPSIQIDAVSDTTGVHKLASSKLNFTVSRPVGYHGPILIQVSKPDFFFENFSQEEQVNVVGKTILLPEAHTFILDKTYFNKPGFYQIRALRQDNLGVASDSITIQQLP